MDPASSAHRERRHFVRFPADVPVLLYDEGFVHTHTERTADLAFHGVCVATNDPVAVGTELELEIEVMMPTKISLGYEIGALTVDGPPMSHTARMRGVVRRCETGDRPTLWHIGIEFLQPRERDGERVLELYLDQLVEHSNPDWMFED